MFTEQELAKYQSPDLVKKYVERSNEKNKELLERFKKIQEESSTDFCNIDKTNVIKESNKNINIYHKYITLLAEETLLYEKLEASYDKVKGELFDFYRNHSDISSKLKSESAIEKYVFSHDCYVAINQVVSTQKTLLTYIQNIIENIKARNFTIKNIIESLKIELGLM